MRPFPLVAGALLATTLGAAACSGGAEPAVPVPADVSPGSEDADTASLTLDTAAPADSFDADLGRSSLPTDRGVIAGLDTSIRSVELVDIVFDLFNLTAVTLAEADEVTVLSIVDIIPPLDANRALLSSVEQERVGTVRYLTAAEAAAADYLWDTQLIIGYVADDGQAYAYPISILNFHGIVNETLAGQPVLITYCTLCRSGIVYERRMAGEVLTFGNTSALFENDLVMFDRDPESISYWFQVAGEAVVGARTGQRLAPLASITTEWQAWLAEHPGTFVLSDDTGFDRPYGTDFSSRISGAGEATAPPPFLIDEETLADGRLPISELALIVEIEDEPRAYPLQSLGSLAINDALAGQPLVIFIDSPSRYGAVFDPRVDGRLLTFVLEDGAFVDIETGTRWNRTGVAVEGPLEASQLVALPARTTFWFSILSTFPTVTVAGVDTTLDTSGA